MKTIEQIEANIAALQKDIAELKAQQEIIYVPDCIPFIIDRSTRIGMSIDGMSVMMWSMYYSTFEVVYQNCLTRPKLKLINARKPEVGKWYFYGEPTEFYLKEKGYYLLCVGDWEFRLVDIFKDIRVTTIDTDQEIYLIEEA